MARVNVAVIGTGASALGVLMGLLNHRQDIEITLFDIGARVRRVPLDKEPSPERIIHFYNEIYKEIRTNLPYKFPPTKTHFGERIPREALNGSSWGIYKSETFGGFTNYWGGVLLPFTDREMAPWPITKEALYPYYEQIAKLVGLSGRPDRLNDYFLRDFATLPPIKPTALLDRLDQTVNRSLDDTNAPFEVISGLSRCAIETRAGQPNHCVYCGECMAGCFRNSIYTAQMTIEHYLKDPRIVKCVQGRVTRVSERGRVIYVDTAQGCLEEQGFSKVFLCAGCLSSTEILMRSLGISKGPLITDNAVYDFPILYFGQRPPDASDRRYLGLCNLIFACVPRVRTGYFAQAQIYNNSDYLWRCNVPLKLWPVIQPIMEWTRSHVFWGRLYVHSDKSQAYALEMKDGKLDLELNWRDTDETLIKDLIKSVRLAVNRDGFYIPPVGPIREKANSHYGGTFPYGGHLLPVPPNNEVLPGVYLCDSSSFPEAPAVSSTFTIMANALRIATEAMHG